MDKKEKSFDEEESFFEKKDIANPFEKKEEEVTVEVQPKANASKKPYKVLNLFYGDFILEDSRGCGLRIPIPKEHKNAKIGDTIYL